MSLILIVLSLAIYCSSSAALVTSPSPDNFAPISTSAESRPVRTVWDIRWSCLATLLAVAWISPHPNAPWLEEKSGAFIKRSSLLTRRIILMCLAIVRPEKMIQTAFCQWRNAVMIKETYNKARPRSSPQWTMAHAYFLLMGGFKVNYIEGELPPSLSFAYAVEKNGIMVQERILSFDALQSLLQKQLIDFPDTTAKEINDRSNKSIGTTILKAFAMMQITGFFVDLFARALHHLTITLLEFTTAASVGLIVIMYIIWWSKPFDVREPIVLRTKEVELKLAQMAVGPNEETE